MTVTTVTPVWNETVSVRVRIRSRLSVRFLNYPLTVLTEVGNLGIRASVEGFRVQLLEASAGSQVLTGQPVSLSRRFVMRPAAGSYVTTGFGSGYVRNYLIGTNAGTFTVAGQEAALVRERSPLGAEMGAFAVDGEDVSLRVLQPFPVEVGAFILDGEAANFIRQLKLDGATGNLALTGNVAQLRVDDYFSSWATQTYGFEGLVYPDWWAE